jgi:predicted RNA binding protein YcfA (HicA-like mRNA interferase family)
MKQHELERELRDAGGRFVRIRGSHHLWRTLDGTIVQFSVKGTKSDLAKDDVARVRRALKGKDGRQNRS